REHRPDAVARFDELIAALDSSRFPARPRATWQARARAGQAKALALAGRKDDALAALERAVALGWHDSRALAGDAAFESIRGEPAFSAARAASRELDAQDAQREARWMASEAKKLLAERPAFELALDVTTLE